MENEEARRKSADDEPSKKDFSVPDYWMYCDQCGIRLEPRKCKLICPRCGFFHSCSEP